MTSQTIHETQPVLTTGATLSAAPRAVILLHGRGSTAQSILGLAAQLPQEGVAYLAPQAAGQTWYPNSGFIAIEANEPYVSSAFQTVGGLLDQIARAGIAPEQVVLGGFSQGACLAAEFVARHPRRYGGLFVLSGALLGPPDMPRQYAGSLAGTPILVAGSDRDSWVTPEQLTLTATVMETLGGSVRLAIAPGTDHTIRPAEIAQVRALIAGAPA